MKQRLVGRQLLRFFADNPSLPGWTLGDLMDALRLHAGTATHQRITELRQAGWSIRCNREGREWRYYVLTSEARRMRAYLRERDQKVAA